jgi:hypothetical protein
MSYLLFAGELCHFYYTPRLKFLQAEEMACCCHAKVNW